MDIKKLGLEILRELYGGSRRLSMYPLGHPITQARIVSSPVAHAEADAVLTLLFKSVVWPGVRTDETGNYQLDDLPSGEVQIGVLFDDHRRMQPKRVTLHPGETVEVNFGDQGGFVVAGVVADAAALLERVEVQPYVSRDAVERTVRM